MYLPIEIWYHIALFLTPVELVLLEKALNIDLSYIAKLRHRKIYKAVINSVNNIHCQIDKKTTRINHITGRTVVYSNPTYICFAGSGYYYVSDLRWLSIKHCKLNIKNMMPCKYSVYKNRKESKIRASMDEISNSICVSVREGYHINIYDYVAIYEINTKYKLEYPW